MIGLIILILATIAVIFLVNSYQNKYQSFQGGIFNIFILAVLFFFLGSVAYVYTTSDVSLGSVNGVADFFKMYFAWVLGFFKTVGHVVGYAIKQSWGG